MVEPPAAGTGGALCSAPPDGSDSRLTSTEPALAGHLTPTVEEACEAWSEPPEVPVVIEDAWQGPSVEF